MFSIQKQLLFFVLLSFLSFSCNRIHQPEIIREINTGWKFKKQSDSSWLKAKVPGTVHTDLLDNQLIEDPFYRLNELDLQWIDKCNWEYETSFIVSKKELAHQNAQLTFNGIDTYAEVYLNDSLILQPQNMFLRHKLDCKAILKEGKNTLKVMLHSPIKKGVQQHDSTNYKVPISANDLAELGEVENGKRVSAFMRKAPYHFGWDWGPRLVTSGIWRSVDLSFWSGPKITNSYIAQQALSEEAEFLATATIVSNTEESAQVEVHVNDKVLATQRLALKKGRQEVQIPFLIAKPNLWWPNGMGAQFLYDVALKVVTKNSSAKKEQKLGIRAVELVQQPDSIGSSFYFKINGVPTFAKGVNYIPQDVFLPRVSKQKYRHLLESAAAANMNMIRVWGGGVYEDDYFYELCDSLGLMVWQDFMFACSMYPKDKDLISSIYKEAIGNVSRLRNHPSIVLWCGNNEVLSAWKRWGWEDQNKESQSEEIANLLWSAYDTIFHQVLPSAVKKAAPQALYWSASPSSSRGVKSSNNSGDMHYWGVWWGGEPFSAYEKEIPRFMSEYGFQSFPEFEAIKKFTKPEDHDMYSTVMQSHQRSSIGNKTIEKYLLYYYKKPKDFESLLYVSQLMQAHGIGLGAEAHRKNRARCMGSLYWQLNDCWPVASWSSIDYYGKWKALHYTIKKVFAPVIVTHSIEQDTLHTYVVSDLLDTLYAQINYQLLAFNGKPLTAKSKQITVVPNQSNKHLSVAMDRLLANNEKDNVFLKTELLLNDSLITKKHKFFMPFKALNFSKPKLEIKINQLSVKQFQLTISSNTLAKDVFLSLPSEGVFSDNYFDLIPGQEKQVIFNTKKEFDEYSIRENLKILTLADTY